MFGRIEVTIAAREPFASTSIQPRYHIGSGPGQPDIIPVSTFRFFKSPHKVLQAFGFQWELSWFVLLLESSKEQEVLASASGKCWLCWVNATHEAARAPFFFRAGSCVRRKVVYLQVTMALMTLEGGIEW
ncbi:hypothetical protein H113_04885, partial [Trichophyton rubrum MR1459]